LVVAKAVVLVASEAASVVPVIPVGHQAWAVAARRLGKVLSGLRVSAAAVWEAASVVPATRAGLLVWVVVKVGAVLEVVD
jgi:hypothetical protein